MKIKIVRKDLKPEKMLPRLEFIAESEEEKRTLSQMEQDLNSQFGRGKYHLEFCCMQNIDGNYTLEYRIVPREKK